MPADFFDTPLALAAAALGAIGVVLVLAGIVSFFQLRLVRFVFRILLGSLFLALGALSGGVAVGIQGYRALTHEQMAARITVQPAGAQRFVATFRFPDGREARYELAGDEIYVDAHILKWHPRANLIGLRTGYELDRVAGRYHSVKDERGAVRTVHALGRERPVDLFAIARRYAFLEPLLDAEYGSASFVPVSKPAELELRVSTSGLLIREAKAPK
ncbi:MAG TPA: hypothetical protein VMN03_01600 [Burkholderiales bacterium]|nr:hypothetical protein [Burkholderiales bacterium]